jgi:molybdopterin biosynthesis enzyme
VLTANIAEGQESFKILPLAQNNGWVVLDETKNDWQNGELVPVFAYADIATGAA